MQPLACEQSFKAEPSDNNENKTEKVKEKEKKANLIRNEIFGIIGIIIAT